ncbi:hypothetical protein KSP40_PGU000400 [Platanthera guangdongensis]|uniref:Uncharacterized protein n=1 Tax=Platanthera guangdongensis TaxID=2320717 RepID=A0ABR2LMW7_9ASPA
MDEKRRSVRKNGGRYGSSRRRDAGRRRERRRHLFRRERGQRKPFPVPILTPAASDVFLSGGGTHSRAQTFLEAAGKKRRREALKNPAAAQKSRKGKPKNGIGIVFALPAEGNPRSP